MTLGTGYGDCYQGKMVHYKDDDSAGVLTEIPCKFQPKAGFYRDAVNAGIKGIDTAFIYGTEEQIGREVPGPKLSEPGVFISTKTMTPPFRKMLGVLHGTDKMEEQLRALQRHSVNILYSHEDDLYDDDDDNNNIEWQLLE